VEAIARLKMAQGIEAWQSTAAGAAGAAGGTATLLVEPWFSCFSWSLLFFLVLFLFLVSFNFS
jgi:hypothetical protein